MKTSVLAIDDSRTIRTLLRQALEQDGFEVHVAEDGIDGIKKFDEIKPDVVITDINMPNLDGFGVISQLRGSVHKTTVPILVLTTESSAELKNRARDLGATGWIVKPFDDVALVQVLRRVTGHV
ncbi:response regulator [Sulfitobacter guttiformis]|uniref:Response regulator receiver protein n=1 Tax=Sulfitobacter guttiformis TaxID=74349 RepID=A0A420DH42_9RHOB|nr:response regulator [Sulfitobacter guttiformis]KIN72745.1 Response regulator receiver protein [Sulfitobacter guttiformis KCTC 32187]RKE93541.1 response regulator receiver protein [Sulfitobacter guttiformis]